MPRQPLVPLFLLALLTAGCTGGGLDGPVTPAAPGAAGTSFIDPSATIEGDLRIGDEVFVGPFATVRTGGTTLRIDHHSDLQDNTLLDAGVGREIAIGERVIVAHGASVVGPARVGADGGQAAFVGFNALVQGAVVEPDAMVSALARVGPGVTLRSGRKVLPGRNVTTQQQADDPALGFVADVTDDDRRFMAGVIHVNDELGAGYARLARENPLLVRGISPNPATSLNPVPDTPVLGLQATLLPAFRNRIIGDVRMADPVVLLDERMGSRDAVRADEGRHFAIGTLRSMADEVTFHALEHTEITVGDFATFGRHCVVHGGPDAGNSPPEVTVLGDDVQIGDEAVVFRSTLGDGVLVGRKALVDGCQLAPGTVVPDRAILVQNVLQGFVDW